MCKNMSSSSAIVTTYMLDIPTTPEMEQVRLRVTQREDSAFYDVWYDRANVQVSAYFTDKAACELLAETFKYIAENYVAGESKPQTLFSGPVPVPKVVSDRDPTDDLDDEFSDLYSDS